MLGDGRERSPTAPRQPLPFPTPDSLSLRGAAAAQSDRPNGSSTYHLEPLDAADAPTGRTPPPPPPPFPLFSPVAVSGPRAALDSGNASVSGASEFCPLPIHLVSSGTATASAAAAVVGVQATSRVERSTPSLSPLPTGGEGLPLLQLMRSPLLQRSGSAVERRVEEGSTSSPLCSPPTPISTAARLGDGVSNSSTTAARPRVGFSTYTAGACASSASASRAARRPLLSSSLLSVSVSGTAAPPAATAPLALSAVEGKKCGGGGSSGASPAVARPASAHHGAAASSATRCPTAPAWASLPGSQLLNHHHTSNPHRVSLAPILAVTDYDDDAGDDHDCSGEEEEEEGDGGAGQCCSSPPLTEEEDGIAIPPMVGLLPVTTAFSAPVSLSRPDSSPECAGSDAARDGAAVAADQLEGMVLPARPSTSHRSALPSQPQHGAPSSSHGRRRVVRVPATDPHSRSFGGERTAPVTRRVERCLSASSNDIPIDGIRGAAASAGPRMPQRARRSPPLTPLGYGAAVSTTAATDLPLSHSAPQPESSELSPLLASVAHTPPLPLPSSSSPSPPAAVRGSPAASASAPVTLVGGTGTVSPRSLVQSAPTVVFAHEEEKASSPLSSSSVIITAGLMAMDDDGATGKALPTLSAAIDAETVAPEQGKRSPDVEAAVPVTGRQLSPNHRAADRSDGCLRRDEKNDAAVRSATSTATPRLLSVSEDVTMNSSSSSSSSSSGRVDDLSAPQASAAQKTAAKLSRESDSDSDDDAGASAASGSSIIELGMDSLFFRVMAARRRELDRKDEPTPPSASTSTLSSSSLAVAGGAQAGLLSSFSSSSSSAAQRRWQRVPCGALPSALPRPPSNSFGRKDGRQGGGTPASGPARPPSQQLSMASLVSPRSSPRLTHIAHTPVIKGRGDVPPPPLPPRVSRHLFSPMSSSTTSSSGITHTQGHGSHDPTLLYRGGLPSSGSWDGDDHPLSLSDPDVTVYGGNSSGSGRREEFAALRLLSTGFAVPLLAAAPRTCCDGAELSERAAGGGVRDGETSGVAHCSHRRGEVRAGCQPDRTNAGPVKALLTRGDLAPLPACHSPTSSSSFSSSSSSSSSGSSTQSDTFCRLRTRSHAVVRECHDATTGSRWASTLIEVEVLPSGVHRIAPKLDGVSSSFSSFSSSSLLSSPSLSMSAQESQRHAAPSSASRPNAALNAWLLGEGCSDGAAAGTQRHRQHLPRHLGPPTAVAVPSCTLERRPSPLEADAVDVVPTVAAAASASHEGHDKGGVVRAARSRSASDRSPGRRIPPPPPPPPQPLHTPIVAVSLPDPATTTNVTTVAACADRHSPLVVCTPGESRAAVLPARQVFSAAHRSTHEQRGAHGGRFGVGAEEEESGAATLTEMSKKRRVAAQQHASAVGVVRVAAGGAGAGAAQCGLLSVPVAHDASPLGLDDEDDDNERTHCPRLSLAVGVASFPAPAATVKVKAHQGSADAHTLQRTPMEASEPALVSAFPVRVVDVRTLSTPSASAAADAPTGSRNVLTSGPLSTTPPQPPLSLPYVVEAAGPRFAAVATVAADGASGSCSSTISTLSAASACSITNPAVVSVFDAHPLAASAHECFVSVSSSTNTSGSSTHTSASLTMAEATMVGGGSSGCGSEAGAAAVSNVNATYGGRGCTALSDGPLLGPLSEADDGTTASASASAVSRNATTVVDSNAAPSVFTTQKLYAECGAVEAASLVENTAPAAFMTNPTLAQLCQGGSRGSVGVLDISARLGVSGGRIASSANSEAVLPPSVFSSLNAGAMQSDNCGDVHSSPLGGY